MNEHLFFFNHKPSFWFFWLEDVNVLLHSRLYIFSMQMWCTFALFADQKIESDGVQDLLVLCTVRQHIKELNIFSIFWPNAHTSQHEICYSFLMCLKQQWVLLYEYLFKYWVAAFTQKVCLMTDDRVLFLNGIRLRVDLLLNGKPKHCMIHYI